MSDVTKTQEPTPENINPTEWITPASAARLAGVSQVLLYWDMRLGRLRMLRMAGRTFIHIGDVQKIKELHPKAKPPRPRREP